MKLQVTIQYTVDIDIYIDYCIKPILTTTCFDI